MTNRNRDTGLNYYTSETTLPRPESYTEDQATADAAAIQYKDQPTYSKTTTYTNLSGGAESGWDFSSRWLADATNLYSIDTPSVTPVCLNSIMLRFELNMKFLANELKNTSMESTYSTAATTRYATM